MLALVATLALLAGACTKKTSETADSGGATTVATTESTTTTTSGTATTKAATTSTLPMPAGPPATPLTINYGGTGTAPAGSGCSPPAGPSLPNGTWFGTLKSVDPAAGTIGLDLACYFVGDAANAAAAADGHSEIPVPNDYYIRNQVPTIYTLPAIPNVAYLQLQYNGGSSEYEPTATGLGAAAAGLASFNPDYWTGWIQVTDGYVTVIQQQFRP